MKNKIYHLLGLVFILLLSLSNVSALTSGEATILLGSIISLISVIIFFLVISIITPNSTLKIFFLSLSSIIIVLTIGVGVNIIQQYFSDFTTLAASYGAFYQLFTILLIGGSLALIVYLVVVAVKSFYSYRGLIDEDVMG